jgi:DNA ligase-1
MEQKECRDRQHLSTELDRVLAAGGEGIMLRQPASSYVDGRSSTLLKVRCSYFFCLVPSLVPAVMIGKEIF